MTPEPHWKEQPEEHDFPAAFAFLSLLLAPDVARILVDKLKMEARSGDIPTRKAKDLLRASGLELLERSNAHVDHDLKKIEDGEKLSPVLLVANDSDWPAKLVVADGYHRICASYWIDENTDIPCVISRFR